MTSLEFIEILIEENKKEIELMKNMIVEDDKYPSIKKINEENLKSIEELLAHLQQVKTDLEVWEVVKKHLILDKEFHRIDLHLHHDTIYKEDYLKIKKALEVEDAN